MAVDKELVRQLESAAQSNKAVQAVVTLASVARATRALPSPDAVTRSANDLIDRVSKSSGESPGDFYVMANIGAISVSASPRFLRALIEQPEVDSAIANQQPDED